MESTPRRPRVWYFFSDDLPDGEILVPIKCQHGLAFAVRPNSGMDQVMLDRLNENTEFVLGVGLGILNAGDEDKPDAGDEPDSGDEDEPPEREE
jgi:hypothetical protein